MVPKGGIIQWSGAIVDIPTGYQLCDGTNDTPDLRDQFVIGAGGAFAVDEIGGTETHKHNFTSSSHSHINGNTVNNAGSGPSEAWEAGDRSSDETVTGSTEFDPNIPPFLALAYIQRMV